MWTCKACGVDIVDILTKVDRCPRCGAPRGTAQSDASHAKMGIFSEFSEYSFGELFKFLEIPQSEMVYMSQRPAPRDGESEFDTRDDLPWPELYSRLIASRGRLIPDLPWMQHFFLKRPRVQSVRSSALGVPGPHWRFLKEEAARPAQRRGREIVQIELLRGVVPLVLMLLLVAFFFIMISMVSKIGMPAVVILVIGSLVLGSLLKFSGLIIGFFTDERLVALAKPDMRRQVLRYLEWVKQRRAEEDGQAAPPTAAPPARWP